MDTEEYSEIITMLITDCVSLARGQERPIFQKKEIEGKQKKIFYQKLLSGHEQQMWPFIYRSNIVFYLFRVNQVFLLIMYVTNIQRIKI